MIVTENLGKSFSLNTKESLEVLKDINIELPSGKIILIIGPSGAGKSTLLYILATLDRPTKGKVFWEGRDLSLFSDKELSWLRLQKIGFVFQFFNLIPDLTLEENIFLPLIMKGRSFREGRLKAEKILERMDIYERKSHYPQEVSGGERQKACIARALINDASYIFCDEPTGSLDSQSAQQIIDILLELNRVYKKTIIIVSHNKELEIFGDLVYYLNDGRIVGKKGGD